MGDTNWYCVDSSCGEVLGELEGGELKGINTIPSSCYETRGPNLKVTCPKCGRTKIWFTSDSVTRAMYQLINAISLEAAKKMLREVQRAQ